MASSSPVRTLEESLREANSRVAMYRDLIENGEKRERVIAEEIAALTSKLRFLERARTGAPEALARARALVASLKAQRRANATEGYSGPSRATLARKAERAQTLQERVLAMAAELRAQGLDPVELLREAGDVARG